MIRQGVQLKSANTDSKKCKTIGKSEADTHMELLKSVLSRINIVTNSSDEEDDNDDEFE